LKRHEQIIAVDLGARTTKAVCLEARGNGYALLQYTILDAPVYEKTPNRDLLAEHLKKISRDLGAHTKQLVLALSAAESLLRQAEMPAVPIADLRMMLKLDPKKYLQQDLANYIFDCYILPPKPGAPNPDPGKSTQQKCRAIVSGARKESIELLQTAAKLAGLNASHIVPNLIGPPNALEIAQPEVFAKEVVAVVDLGFKHSTISVLDAGEMKLNRVVDLGGDRFTASLAEALNVSYAEAEGIKVGMPQEVESNLLPLLSPLGRELRASIDFFEHQQDKTVSQIFISGAAARADYFIQALQAELIVPCKHWNPTSFLELLLPPQQRMELEQVSSQLAVAVGTSLAAF
jgi:type IV pilus assembly protein PilM